MDLGNGDSTTIWCYASRLQGTAATVSRIPARAAAREWHCEKTAATEMFEAGADPQYEPVAQAHETDDCLVVGLHRVEVLVGLEVVRHMTGTAAQIIVGLPPPA